jgi:hypothetical protein
MQVVGVVEKEGTTRPAAKPQESEAVTPAPLNTVDVLPAEPPAAKKPKALEDLIPSLDKADEKKNSILPGEKVHPTESLIPSDKKGQPTKSLIPSDKKGQSAENVIPLDEKAKEKKLVVPASAGSVDLVDLFNNKMANVQIVNVTMNLVTVSVVFPGEDVVSSDKIPSEVVVSFGTYFRSSLPHYQNLIVVTPLKMPVTGRHPVTLHIWTCCTNNKKSAPNHSNYRLEKLPENNKIVRFVEHYMDQNIPIATMQSAVWNFTTQMKLND